MEFWNDLLLGCGTAHSILVIALTITVGVSLSKLKIRGVSLGVTWVLFAGIMFRELGLEVDNTILGFARDFGLIIFVFTIGLQIGPGFFSVFYKGGLKFIFLAIIVMLLGVGITYLLAYCTDTPLQTMVGVMNGSVTNTPAMGAARQTYMDTFGVDDNSIPLSYAVAYPFGVLAAIISLILVKSILGVDVEKDRKILEESQHRNAASKFSIIVRNSSINGKMVSELRQLVARPFVVSRISHESNVAFIADSDSRVYTGDRMFIVSSEEDKEAILAFLGEEIDMLEDEWGKFEGQLVSRRIVITRSEINGKRFADLRLRSKYGINITRVNRAGVDLIPYQGMELQLGDKVMVVGSEDAIKHVEAILGNSLSKLHQPHIVTIFLGIAIGVIIGSIPIAHIPHTVKLGLAAGPMLVAILIGRFGTHFHLITYTTLSANLMVREVGLTLFLASVGLSTGGGFIPSIVEGGYIWGLYALIICMVPLLIAGIYAKHAYKLDYFTIMGVLAGTVTNPMALNYANSSAGNDIPSVCYATVYPLVMFLRVVIAQFMIMGMAM